MWPGLVLRVLRSYAPYITVPFAAVIGLIGYKIENIVSDKYTPYSESIKEARSERQISDAQLQSADTVEPLRYKANVLGRNVSPSLLESK